MHVKAWLTFKSEELVIVFFSCILAPSVAYMFASSFLRSVSLLLKAGRGSGFAVNCGSAKRLNQSQRQKNHNKAMNRMGFK
jgi:hypothetical protein